MSTVKGRVLIIAGSDSGGGAGIQADIKTVTALGGFAMTAVTAITVQNTRGVFAVEPVSPGVIRDQIKVVMDDIGADVIKIGMLGTAPIVMLVAEALAQWAPQTPLVLDPVMVAKGGHALLEDDAVEALRQHLIGRATLITPNAPEAERLTGRAVQTLDDQCTAAFALTAMGARHALVKGGHIAGDILNDVLAGGQGAPTVFSDARIATTATHGTGCTLSSAIAISLAQGMTMDAAVRRAREYLRGAILNAPGFGGGHGPLGHAWARPRSTE